MTTLALGRNLLHLQIRQRTLYCLLIVMLVANEIVVMLPVLYPPDLSTPTGAPSTPVDQTEARSCPHGVRFLCPSPAASRYVHIQQQIRLTTAYDVAGPP